MRLCQPYLVSLQRSLIASSLFGGVQAALWLAAVITLTRLIDSRLTGQHLSQSAPWAVAFAIAASGAGLLGLLRTTLINRRRIWLDHALGEKVVEYDLWVAADGRQRARSLAAVTTLSRFLASPGARALADLPWALAALAAAWLVDADLAAIANVAALVLILMALTSTRRGNAAEHFDLQMTAQAAGDTLLAHNRLGPDAHALQAHAIAGRWEETQRSHLADAYRTGQANARRRLCAGTLLVLAALSIGAVVLERPATGSQATSVLVVVAATLLAALGVLATAAIGGPTLGRARAAREHLLLLRVSRSAPATIRQSRIAGPDLRAPATAAVAAVMVTLLALAATARHWNLPLPALAGFPVFGVVAAETARPPAPVLRRDKA